MEKIKITATHLERDINNSLRLILTAEDGTEYVLEDEVTNHGFVTAFTPKPKSWYFDEKNRIKKPGK